MKVFVSSVVSGFEHYLAAARKVVSLLGHTPVLKSRVATVTRWLPTSH